MASDLSLQAANVPLNTCYPGSVQGMLNLITRYITVEFEANASFINFGPTTPSASFRDRPWVKTNPDGSLDGLYVFYDGDWRDGSPFTKGVDVMMHWGEVSDIVLPWAYCDGSTVNGVVTPDLREKFVIPSGDTKPWKTTGGSETHTLSQSEMPPHSHSVTVQVDMGQDNGPGWAGEGRRGGNNNNFSGSTNSVGGGAAHNNMPPYVAIPFKMYVGFS